MTYYNYVYASPSGQPAGFVSTPPLASYYSPRVAPYKESRRSADAYGYSPSPGARYGHSSVSGVRYQSGARVGQSSSRPVQPSRLYRGTMTDPYLDVQTEEFEEAPAFREDYFAKTSPRHAAPRTRKTSSGSGPRPVTAQDRAEAGIPAGYSTKNWDPAEEPIFLLGSVFDANSLGKWIYDWTVYRHGPGTVALGVAGDLWLALIALAGKIRQAEHLLRRKGGNSSKRRVIEDFLDDGDELWEQFRALLRKCEKSMMRVARRDHGTGQVVSMGASSGCEFVDYIFGEGRGLEQTEDLIHSMSSWDKRFEYTLKKGRSRRTA